MSVVIPNNFMQVIHPFQHDLVSERWSTTYAVDVDALGNAQANLDQLHSIWVGEWVNNVDSQVLMQPAIGYHRTNTGNLELLTAAGAAVRGTLTQASASPQVSVVIRKRTAFVGRSQRGRMYLPSCFVGEGIVDEAGLVLPAAVAVFQTGADSLLTQIQAVTGSEGMWLLHSDPLKTPSFVTDLVVQNVIRTQRRRIAA